MDNIIPIFILTIYIVVFGIIFASPAIFAVKHAGKLFLLSMVVSGPLFYGIVLLNDFINLAWFIDLILSFLPEAMGQVLFSMLIPVWPALVVFLLLWVFAKRYVIVFGLKRLFFTLVCSSTIGLLISYGVIMSAPH